jgi:hypothetical protein
MITGVGKVVLSVEDQQAAKEFWTTLVGFDLCRDETYGDERWIEVRPPGAGRSSCSPAAPPMSRGATSPICCRTPRCSSTARTSRRPTRS